MAENNDIPSIPLPPSPGGVPPVEPTPATPPVEPTPGTPPAPPAPPAPPTPPSIPGAPEPLPPVTPPRPDPYAAPGAAPNPYAQPQAGYAAPPSGYTAPPAYGQPYAYAPVAAGPVQGLSIASMILGIASVVLALFSLGFLPALAAVITGHLAQRRQPYARPFWLAGLITGYIGLGIALIWGLFIVVAFVVGITTNSYGY